MRWRRHRDPNGSLGDNSTFTAEECAALASQRTDKSDRVARLTSVRRLGIGRHRGVVASRCTSSMTRPRFHFAPVMAGVLLAGEIVKERVFQDAVLDSYCSFADRR